MDIPKNFLFLRQAKKQPTKKQINTVRSQSSPHTTTTEMVRFEDVSDVSDTQLAQQEQQFSQSTEEEKEQTLRRRSTSSTAATSTSGGDHDHFAQPHPQQQQSPFPFLFSPLLWYILLPFGLILTGVIAFSDLKALASESKGFWSITLVRLFLGLFVNIQFMIKMIFWAAMAAHVFEALVVAFLMPNRASTVVRWAWIAQTFLLGFASLKPFMILCAKQMIQSVATAATQDMNQNMEAQEELRRMMMGAMRGSHHDGQSQRRNH